MCIRSYTFQKHCNILYSSNLVIYILLHLIYSQMNLTVWLVYVFSIRGVTSFKLCPQAHLLLNSPCFSSKLHKIELKVNVLLS